MQYRDGFAKTIRAQARFTLSRNTNQNGASASERQHKKSSGRVLVPLLAIAGKGRGTIQRKGRTLSCGRLFYSTIHLTAGPQLRGIPAMRPYPKIGYGTPVQAATCRPL